MPMCRNHNRCLLLVSRYSYYLKWYHSAIFIGTVTAWVTQIAHVQ